MATKVKSKHGLPMKAERAAEKTPLATKSERADERPIWEIIAEIGSQISDEEWEKVPEDFSINYKHYLYGAPKKHL